MQHHAQTACHPVYRWDSFVFCFIRRWSQIGWACLWAQYSVRLLSAPQDSLSISFTSVLTYVPAVKIQSWQPLSSSHMRCIACFVLPSSVLAAPDALLGSLEWGRASVSQLRSFNNSESDNKPYMEASLYWTQFKQYDLNLKDGATESSWVQAIDFSFHKNNHASKSFWFAGKCPSWSNDPTHSKHSKATRRASCPPAKLYLHSITAIPCPR